jgi:hypothetical protein
MNVDKNLVGTGNGSRHFADLKPALIDEKGCPHHRASHAAAYRASARIARMLLGRKIPFQATAQGRLSYLHEVDNSAVYLELCKNPGVYARSKV